VIGVLDTGFVASCGLASMTRRIVPNVASATYTSAVRLPSATLSTAVEPSSESCRPLKNFLPRTRSVFCFVCRS